MRKAAKPKEKIQQDAGLSTHWTARQIFARLPHWAVSIALEHRGKIVAGVVFDVAKDEMFVAEKGSGAWMNDARIRVSDRRYMRIVSMPRASFFG